MEGNRRFNRIAVEIKRFQRSTDLLIARASFGLLVRQILFDKHPCGLEFRWQKAGIEFLQEAAEAFLVHYFGDANMLAHYAK